MRRERPPPTHPLEPMPCARRVTAQYPDHLWHVDLTTVPTSAGFWASWCPFALPQCWPFCWWLAVILDHFSRRVHGVAVFAKQPTSEQVRRFLGRVVAGVGRAARHLGTDQGEQFHCTAFQRWCRVQGMRQRFGGVGKQGSIAVVERFLRTLKQECTRVVAVVPLLRRALCRELQLYSSWYNAARPHTTLAGATPDEVYLGRRPARRMPRFEPRPAWRLSLRQTASACQRATRCSARYKGQVPVWPAPPAADNPPPGGVNSPLGIICMALRGPRSAPQFMDHVDQRMIHGHIHFTNVRTRLDGPLHLFEHFLIKLLTKTVHEVIASFDSLQPSQDIA